MQRIILLYSTLMPNPDLVAALVLSVGKCQYNGNGLGVGSEARLKNGSV